MRTNIVHSGAGELTYEIRNIVSVGEQLQELGVTVNWENIGDPVAKGEQIPSWMKAIVAEAAQDNASFGYSPTRGVLSTRQFIADQTNALGGAQITANDILFFNGLGDAISKVFSLLRPTARVIVPTPSYSTHSSAEAAHAGDSPITYILDPNKYWYPDLEDLENHVKYNPAIAGILVINPDNPTGAVYPEHILRGIVDIADRYDLFIVCDEVYQNMVYNGTKAIPLATVIGKRVPAICMRGVSKEMPWPGGRCGWMEVYNGHHDCMFEKYVSSILNAKMMEVCSTTLPQLILPKVTTHPEYRNYLEERICRYEKYSNIAYDILKKVKGVLVNRTNGAFYMSVVFEHGLLNQKQSLPIVKEEVRATIEKMVKGPKVEPDKRFVYYLLGSTGICVVPLSSFATTLQGFRITLLERDEATFTRIFQTIAAAIQQYIASA